MNEITLTQAELPALNRERFAEDLAATLGAALSVTAEMERGALLWAQISREDGQPFSADQVQTVRSLASLHDSTLLSAEQTAARDRLLDRAWASKTLLRYDPAGLAEAIDTADSPDALRQAAAQLAHLVAALAVIVQTQSTS